MTIAILIFLYIGSGFKMGIQDNNMLYGREYEIGTNISKIWR